MGHKHTFRPAIHLDGCHYISDVAACACGATLATETERDPSRDPYAPIFLSPDCLRCRELLDGADVRFNYRQAGPKGRTVRQGETHVAQEEAVR